jgi:hypothetical protein
MQLSSSKTSYILLGLMIYFAEKHIKHGLQKAKGPFSRTVADPFWPFYPYLSADLYSSIDNPVAVLENED